MNPAVWTRRPVVYRCYDADGVLIYIGSSIDIERRWTQHQRDTFWAARVARVRLQILPDELTARRAEAKAIGIENPRFNLNHRRPIGQWTEQDYHDVIKALRRNRRTTTTDRRARSLKRQLDAFQSGARS